MITRWTLHGESEVILHDGWLPPPEADDLLAMLLRDIPWEAKEISIFGKKVMQPRLVAWMGDSDAVYTYSGLTLTPLPWSEGVAHVRAIASQAAGEHFNSVLFNLYRDGRDSMGFHSDDEPELGLAPCIASVSLGATRKFRLRPRRMKGMLEPLEVGLGHGSLLVMRGGTQAHWVHGVPKEPGVDAPRVNLTFRRVFSGRPR
jgi:alkylated DNA repair dioxygenase AlkB